MWNLFSCQSRQKGSLYESIISLDSNGPERVRRERSERDENIIKERHMSKKRNTGESLYLSAEGISWALKSLSCHFMHGSGMNDTLSLGDYVQYKWVLEDRKI